jgi:hypothetical protein
MKRILFLAFALFMPILGWAGQYGTVTATTAATSVLAATKQRVGVMICNDSSSKIYLGYDVSVTTSTGTPIAANSCYSASGGQEVWKGVFAAITTTGTADVRYHEYTIGDVIGF